MNSHNRRRVFRVPPLSKNVQKRRRVSSSKKKLDAKKKTNALIHYTDTEIKQVMAEIRRLIAASRRRRM
jgi:predicted site-specific integrase-resolvase